MLRIAIAGGKPKFLTLMLIVIEGIDGSGKTTQTELLVKKLKSDGRHSVASLDFPQYNQFFGRAVKSFLNGEFGKIDQVDPHLASTLYALDRWQSKNKLLKWLKQKKIIVLNRYTTANLLHQTIKLSLTKRTQFTNWIKKMEYDILGLPKPDLVIYLYLPAQLSYGLITKRGNKKDIHESNMNHLKSAAKQGLKLTRTSKNWCLVRCNQSKKILEPQIIANKIWKIVNSNF